MPRPRHDARGGSVYVLVLVLSMILAVIGVSAVAVSRINGRTMSQGGDWYEARGLAFSGAEHAMSTIQGTPTWRTTYNGQTVQQSLGQGTFSWRLTDETDGNLVDDPAENFVIFSTGTVRSATYTLRVSMKPGSAGLTYGIATPTTVLVDGGALVDSFDSSLGAYGGGNVSSLAKVATNSTASGAVAVSGGSTLKGSALVGAGGNPATVVKVTGGGTITGTKTALPQAMAMPTVTAPSGMGSTTGNASYGNGGTFTLSGNMHVTNFTVGGGVTILISGSVTIQADGPVSIGNGAVVEVLPGASLKFYFKNSLTLDGGVANRVDGGNLSRMQFLNLGAGTVTLTGGATLTGAVVSPNGPVVMNGGSRMAGAIVAKSLRITNGAFFHEDRRITGGTDPVNVGGSGASTPRPVAWRQVVN